MKGDSMKAPNFSNYAKLNNNSLSNRVTCKLTEYN